MRLHPRLPTQVGLGAQDVDGLDAEGPAPESARPLSLSCAAPANDAPPSTRYSYVAPRRPTLSMLESPLATDEVKPSRRRPTLRLRLV